MRIWLADMEQKIKRLRASLARDIKLKNAARIANGLSPITVGIRACIRCGRKFESAGNRMCNGCFTKSRCENENFIF